MPRFITEEPEITSFCSDGIQNCSRKKVVTETDTETLMCQVSASPEALVYWSYLGSSPENNEQPLDTHERRMTDNHDGRLEIKNLRRNDTGYYKCFANNTEGEDYDVMHLHVKGKHWGLSTYKFSSRAPICILWRRWVELYVLSLP